MKKFIKGLLIFVGAFLLISTVFHHIMLAVEDDKLNPPGTMTNVDGVKMHVYAEGDKTNPTLVFMSGSATVAPVYDFKPLYSLLNDDFRIVVVEKPGYGYSDYTDSQRDVETMLSETRMAIELAGEKPPYILIPHSMSGIEALYWAQQYPQEVSAIIGLDMAIPSSYDNFNFDKTNRLFLLGRASVLLGLHRSLPFVYPKNENTLTDDEIYQQKLLIYKNAVNNIYIEEGRCISDSADLLEQNKLGDVPILMFASNGEGLDDGWVSSAQKFASEYKAQIQLLDCSHYVHYFKSDEIAESLIKFTGELDSEK